MLHCTVEKQVGKMALTVSVSTHMHSQASNLFQQDTQKYAYTYMVYQTSDKMDRWINKVRTSLRTEEQKREDQRRERGSRKQLQVREKVEKSPRTLCF